MHAAAILQELRSFENLGTVLYVAAHPDDENTRLIGFLARGRGYRTGYLSLTRGDGGQNLIGAELGDELGVIRTQELLAARHIDGGEQFFTRAKDFGFSKDARETLAIWDRDEVLADMVRVIRTFRPDVLVTRFPPEGGGGHGHHTSSAMLAIEAFKLAADPAAFRDQLGHLPTWQPKRVLWNAFRRGAATTAVPDGLRLDVGGYNPLLGESYGELAARARTMHKSQGFGSVGSRGPAWESFTVIAGDPATADFMEGIDTSWARVPGGAAIGEDVAQIIGSFEAEYPGASVPALLSVRRALAALPEDATLAHKRRQLDRIVAACLGLYVETTVPRADAVPGETLKLRHQAIVRAPGKIAVEWKRVRYPSITREVDAVTRLENNIVATRDETVTLPADAPVSQPYWLRVPQGGIGMFRVDDPALVGRPENGAALPIEHVFEIEGQTLIVADAPVQVIDDPVKGEIRRRLEVIPPVALAFVDELALLAPGATGTIEIEATAARAGAGGKVALEAPVGWSVSPVAGHSLSFGAAGEKRRVAFTVTAPAQPASAAIAAAIEIDGRRFSSKRVEIRHEHIPPVLLQPPARLKAVALDVAVRSRHIGYLPGAGDAVSECLARLGCRVTSLGGADLTRERLRAFDAVVLGVRAFNTRDDLVAQLPELFAYVEAGGNVIVQYNTTADLKSATLAPFPLRLSRDRVTDENSPVTLLAPDHPALNVPNKITAADFEGWVQERGLYFPDQWDARFTPLLALNDPGERPVSGALLVAQHGQGWFVYSGLSWFRELPAGVPGAYRLFANLVSLGK